MSELQQSQPQPSTSSLTEDKKSKGKDKRSKQRKENYREKKSTEVDTVNKKVIYDKLYFGFKNLSDAMISMQVTTEPSNIILPISTRAAGFIVRYLVSKFSRLGIRNIDFHAFCCSMYRVTLLAMDIKIMCAMANQVGKNTGRNNFQSVDIGIDYVRVIGEFGAGFSPIQNFINSLGIFKGFGTNYVPRYANLPVQEGVVTWDPTMITFSSLRQYVAALSLVATPRETRQAFYDHSPLPNAIWGGRRAPARRDAAGEPVPDDFPQLLNPDDIMPNNYNLANLRADVNIIMDAIETVGRKYEKYTSIGKVDFNANGSATQLVSSNIEDIRCADLQENRNYSMALPITGTVEDFWSSEVISDPEFYLGMFHLTGELPITAGVQHHIRRIVKLTSSGDYNSCLSNLLG